MRLTFNTLGVFYARFLRKFAYVTKTNLFCPTKTKQLKSSQDENTSNQTRNV